MGQPIDPNAAGYGQLATVQQGGELAPLGMMSGLEDFTAEDLKLARLVIDQKAGCFKDSLSGAEYPSVDAITLGVIKQRVMWQPTVEDDSVPLCKSTDYNTGYPTTWEKPANNFPWQASGWNPSDFAQDELGRTMLPCASCRFTQWKTHPDGKKPWCSTQHAVPLLYAGVGEDPYIQAIFTMQRSSLQASQTYFAGFMAKSLPAFSAKCRITLTKLKRGQNDYYVPALRIIEQVDQDRWPELSESYRTMREFLTRPPVTRDESGGAVATNVAASNVIQATPGFENNTWVPQPTPAVQQQVIQQPMVQQPVVQQPLAVPVQAPAQQAAPIAQPVQQAAIATPIAPAQPVQQYVAPDDDPPF